MSAGEKSWQVFSAARNYRRPTDITLRGIQGSEFSLEKFYGVRR